MTIKTETYISGSTLGPIVCSAGGVPYNKEHLDAKDAEIARLTNQVGAFRRTIEGMVECEKALQSKLGQRDKQIFDLNEALISAEIKLEECQKELAKAQGELVRQDGIIAENACRADEAVRSYQNRLGAYQDFVTALAGQILPDEPDWQDGDFEDAFCRIVADARALKARFVERHVPKGDRFTGADCDFYEPGNGDACMNCGTMHEVPSDGR